MKHLLYILLGLMPLGAFAQSSMAPAVYYEYDAAGNRKLRRVLISTDRRGDTTVVEPPAPILTDNSIVAWPNPTNGAVNVAVSPQLIEAAAGRYMVTDMQGRVLMAGEVAQDHFVIDLTGQALGNYLLSVMAGGRREDWQIVKVP